MRLWPLACSEPNCRTGREGAIPNPLIGARMKKKNRKQRKRRQAARREGRAVQAKRRKSVQKKKVESASTPWLRIAPTGIEDDPSSDVSRGLFSDRNGRRQPRDLDLYIPEHDLRNR